MSLINQYKPDKYTKLLLHFNGDLHDSSRGGHSVNPFGGSFDATIKKFGSHSLTVDGTDYVSIDSHNDLRLGGFDWTIDFWVYPTFSSGEWGDVLNKTNPSTSYGYRIAANSSDDTWRVWLTSNGSTWDLTTGNGISIGDIQYNEWQHIAVTYDGSTYRTFLNGVPGGTVVSSTAIYNDDYALEIGRLPYSGTYDFDGSVDEVRISKGIARWTADFSDDEMFKLVLWNKLGSLEEAEQSAVGPWFVASGTLEFVDAVHGKGLQKVVTSSNLLTTDVYDGPTDNCTIEFWWVPDHDEDGSYQVFFNVGNTKYPSGLSEWLFIGFFTDPAEFTVLTRDSSTYRSEYYWHVSYVADTPYHFSVVLDSSAGSNQRIKFYLNGVNQGTGSIYAGRDSAWSMSNSNYARIASGLNIETPLCEGPIDNLKIWNYKKTDFSDRFREGSHFIGYPDDTLYRPYETYKDLIVKHPESWWPLDQEDIVDKGTRPLTGINYGAVFTPGIGRGGVGSYYFNHSQDTYVGFGNNGDWSGPPKSVSVWFKIRHHSGGDGWHNIVGKADYLTYWDGWLLQVNPKLDRIILHVGNNTTSFHYTQADKKLDKPYQWTHVAAVWKSTGYIDIYVNGNKVSSTDSGLPWSGDTSNSYELQVGKLVEDAYDHETLGYIQDVQIYDEELSSVDIESIYRYGVVVDPSVEYIYPELFTKEKIRTINENRWKGAPLNELRQSLEDEQTRIITAEDF